MEVIMEILKIYIELIVFGIDLLISMLLFVALCISAGLLLRSVYVHVKRNYKKERGKYASYNKDI